MIVHVFCSYFGFAATPTWTKKFYFDIHTFIGLFKASWMSNLLRIMVASSFLSNASRSMYAWDSGTRSRTFHRYNNHNSENSFLQSHNEVYHSMKILHSPFVARSCLPFSSFWKNEKESSLSESVLDHLQCHILSTTTHCRMEKQFCIYFFKTTVTRKSQSNLLLFFASCRRLACSIAAAAPGTNPARGTFVV